MTEPTTTQDRLTVGKLRDLLTQLIDSGISPDSAVLTYRDPEGNGLVSLEGWVGLASLGQDKWRVTAKMADSQPSNTDEITPDHRNTHVVLSAWEDIDWDF